MSKRISALLLAVVLVAGSVLNGNTLKVKAASATVAMSPELAAEFYMVLLQLAETAMHVSGANNGFNNKAAMEAIGDGVQGYFVTSMSEGVDFEFQTTDGQTFKSYSNSGYRGGLVEYTTADGQTYKLSGDKFTSLLLNGTITLDPDIYNDTEDKPTVNKDDEYVKNMKAMFDAKWDELKEIGFDDGSGGDPTPSPSPDPKKVFTKIALVSLGTSLIAVAGAFVKDLFDGKVEGIDPDTYLPDGMFTGYPTESNAGKINIYASYFYNNSSTLSEEKYSYNATNEDCFYFLASYGTTASGSYILKPGIYYISSGRTVFPSYSYLQDDLGNAFTFNWISYPVPDTGYRFGNYTIVSNIPIFAHFGFDAYCKGDTSMLLHAPDIYDFPDLVKSVPEVLQPLTGTKFSPSLLPGINTAVSNAVKSLPETSTDTKANTETYKETMTSTITDVAPKTEVAPLPSTTPGTETGDGFEGDSYKRDLKLIFPFCIPFDFIHFIQALSADPVAPCFKIPIKLDSLGIDMVLELDLAWMDPVMEIFRLGELGCFVIMLMAATKKMIGW